VLRNHAKPYQSDEEALERPVTHKQVWDWIAILRWGLPGLVVAALWVWNTSAVSAARETSQKAERETLIQNQTELAESMGNFSSALQRATISMERWITVVETHEKRLDKLEAR
jgi:cyanate permease